MQKILEDADIRLASVATDVMGVSGRAILSQVLAGEQDVTVLAELSRGRLRRKKAELTQALEGRFRPHHAPLLSRILAHIDFLEEQIGELEEEIEKLCHPFELEVQRLDTIPGVDRRAAQDLIAETGVDMSPFPSHKHLCSWAGVRPGNNESAGKRKSGRTRKGNKWLRTILVESAHAAGRSRGTYLGAQYHRLTGRKGKKRAAVAVAHTMLEAVYFMIRDRVEYRDLGADYFDQLNRDHLIRYHRRRLEELGLTIEIKDLSAAA